MRKGGKGAGEEERRQKEKRGEVIKIRGQKGGDGREERQTTEKRGKDKK